MSKQIKTGAAVIIGGQTFRVVRSERPRTGERERMYVVERCSDGHRETRTRSTVLARLA